MKEKNASVAYIAPETKVFTISPRAIVMASEQMTEQIEGNDNPDIPWNN